MNVLKIPDSFRIESQTIRFMFYTLFCLIVADGLITRFLVTNGHAAEINPFLQAWVGQDLFLAIKVSGAFLATLFLWLKYNTMPKAIYITTALFLAFYTGVIFWNLFAFIVAWLWVFPLSASKTNSTKLTAGMYIPIVLQIVKRGKGILRALAFRIVWSFT